MVPKKNARGKRTFSDWLREDKAFVREVQTFQTQATFAALGIDPQVIADSWDSNEQKFTVTPLDLVNRSGLAVAQVAPIPPKENEDGPAESPVQDLTGTALESAMMGAARTNNIEFLKAVRDRDTRVSLSVEAQKLIHKLTHEQK